MVSRLPLNSAPQPFTVAYVAQWLPSLMRPSVGAATSSHTTQYSTLRVQELTEMADQWSRTALWRRIDQFIDSVCLPERIPRQTTPAEEEQASEARVCQATPLATFVRATVGQHASPHPPAILSTKEELLTLWSVHMGLAMLQERAMGCPCSGSDTPPVGLALPPDTVHTVLRLWLQEAVLAQLAHYASRGQAVSGAGSLPRPPPLAETISLASSEQLRILHLSLLVLGHNLKLLCHPTSDQPPMPNAATRSLRADYVRCSERLRDTSKNLIGNQNQVAFDEHFHKALHAHVMQCIPTDDNGSLEAQGDGPLLSCLVEYWSGSAAPAADDPRGRERTLYHPIADPVPMTDAAVDATDTQLTHVALQQSPL